MGKNTSYKSKAVEIYSSLTANQNHTAKSKQVAEQLGVEYTDTFRRTMLKWILKADLTSNDQFENSDSNFENESITETNQYSKIPRLSALKPDNGLMTIDEYCLFYSIPREQVKSFKLVSHTSIPYYNIASVNVDEGVEELLTKDFIEELVSRLNLHAPEYKTFERVKLPENNLLIIDCADIHINKLSLAYETGEEYNIDIAVQRVIEGFTGILAKAEAFNISRIMLVIGNDVLHTDNAKSTTTSGTFQDVTTSLTEAFNAALKLYVNLVDTIIKDYDVDVVFNPSNHDYMSGWMLARTLESWFRTSGNVKFFTDMRHRKYYQFGSNMICTSHGDGSKMQDLPMLMATEDPIMWASTKFRYAYLHHIHHKQTTKFQSGKDYIGVTVEYLRSPSSADRWHYTNGFTGAKKAVEGFIHSEQFGQIARITHYF